MCFGCAVVATVATVAKQASSSHGRPRHPPEERWGTLPSVTRGDESNANPRTACAAYNKTVVALNLLEAHWQLQGNVFHDNCLFTAKILKLYTSNTSTTTNIRMKFTWPDSRRKFVPSVSGNTNCRRRPRRLLPTLNKHRKTPLTNKLSCRFQALN